MTDVWNDLQSGVGVCRRCHTPRRAQDARCRRCGQPFEASAASLSLQPTLATLVLRQQSPPGGDSQSWQVSNAPLEVGRERAAITLRDKSVSRRHARLSPDGQGGFLVEDVGSLNGTFVNNQPVQAPSPVRDGDQVAFGDVVLRAQIRRPTVSIVPPEGTILYDPAAMPVAMPPAQPSSDPTIHEDEGLAQTGAVRRPPAATRPPTTASSPVDFGHEVLELAYAVETIATRLRALEAAWREHQNGRGGG